MLDVLALEPQVEKLAEYVASKKKLATATVLDVPVRTMLNFAHQLTPAQTADLESRVGAVVVEIHVPAQFSLESPLRPQVKDLLELAERRARSIGAQSIDYVIPPSLAPAAFAMAEALALADRTNRTAVVIVWLRRDDASVPPKFVIGGVE